MTAYDLKPMTFTVTELCKVLQISKWTAYRELRAGRIPAKRIGGKWLVFKDKLKEWSATN